MEANKYEPYLKTEVEKVQKLDNKIKWFESKIKELEEEKQQQLRKTMELFDSAMVSKHILKNGYTVKVDDRYAMNILDTGKFLKWMKTNCEPHEVLEFFTNSLKVAALKKFCSQQVNKMRDDGKLGDEIVIDGIEILEKDFRRLTTEKRKVAK